MSMLEVEWKLMLRRSVGVETNVTGLPQGWKNINGVPAEMQLPACLT